MHGREVRENSHRGQEMKKNALLRSSVVVGLRVHEVTGLEVVECHRDGEVLVGGDRRTVGWVGEFGAGHVRRASDDTHRRGIAGASRDLLSVGDGLVADGQAEVDEVVVGRQRGNLSCSRSLLSIRLETLCDDGGIKS